MRPIIRCATTGAGAQNIMNIQGSNFMIKGIAFTQGSRGVHVGPGGMWYKDYQLFFSIFFIWISYIVTRNAIFDNIYIYNTTGTAFSANDVGIEYVNITLRNSEITNTNAYGMYHIVNKLFCLLCYYFQKYSCDNRRMCLPWMCERYLSNSWFRRRTQLLPWHTWFIRRITGWISSEGKSSLMVHCWITFDCTKAWFIQCYRT